MKKKIVYILGTRPEIIRSAAIINNLRNDKSVDFKVVHTGQHYDFLMNDIFFKELGVQPPDINLNIGSISPASQISRMILSLEEYFTKFKPDEVCVFGDTNSSLAGALTALKMKITLTHLEAGFRDREMDIPEETNRIMIDHVSNLLLPVSDICRKNLINEKVSGKVVVVGDPLFDVFENSLLDVSLTTSLKKIKSHEDDYILVTLHRDKNVDDPLKLEKILNAFGELSNLRFIFPVHPRTRIGIEKLKKLNTRFNNIELVDPLGYKKILELVMNSKLVITDSGGLQKEVFWCNKPCLILRDNTGWIEPVNYKVSFLCKLETKEIISQIYYVINNYKTIMNRFSKLQNPYFKKNNTIRIVNLIKDYAGRQW